MLAVAPASDNEYDYLLKVLLIGDSEVGKSTLLLRYADAEWRHTEATIGVDFKICTHHIDDKAVRMQIWDTAGQERFRTIVTSYYRGAHGVIVCYDMTDRDSFDHVKSWVDESRRYADGRVLLVATKADLVEKRKVSKDEGQQLADELQVKFIETSAKTDDKVQEAFHELCKEALEALQEKRRCSQPKAEPGSMNLQDSRLPLARAVNLLAGEGVAGEGTATSCCGA
mmetsp:Transcript_81597/g.182405  ORF Transcript_81597/g.182405 Transcript_81597/m.182405 type:complete len:227 (-) Transcript_81597:25-705(-)